MAKPVGKWTVEQVDEARAMLARGLSLKAVGEHLGVSADTVKCKVDPAYLERRKQQNNQNRRENRRYEPMNSIGRITVHDRVDPDCVAARLAEIPRFDRRDYTGRLLGDPLPERSALARKHLDRET